MRFTNLTRGAGIGSNCYRLDLPEGAVLLDCGMHPEHVGHNGIGVRSGAGGGVIHRKGRKNE